VLLLPACCGQCAAAVCYGPELIETLLCCGADGREYGAAVVSEVKSPMKPIPYSFTWLFTEQYNIVRREAYSNIIAAIVSTFVITIFFLNHFF